MNPFQFCRQVVRLQKDALNFSNNSIALFEDQAQSLMSNLVPMDDKGIIKLFFKTSRESRDLVTRNLETVFELQESFFSAFDS